MFTRTQQQIAVFTCAVVLGTAAPALAQQERGVSLSFDLGAELAGPGDLHGGGPGVVLGLPTQVEPRSYGDTHGTGFTWAVGAGLPTSASGEIRLAVRYTTNVAERLQVGNVAGLPLFAQFDDYKAFGVDAGYRQYLSTSRVRPFVGVSVGFVRLSELDAEFTVPDAGVTLSGVDFLDTSTVPAFGAGAGVQVDLSSRLAFQAGLDFRWHGAFTDRDGLAGTGLEPINDDTARWAMPLTVGMSVGF